jgi:uncharacterized Zn-binding protein involved in type VI secretion
VSVTVFAESMGFFHKGSGGKGVAPGDVCLSPPTPPAGPLPVPYVNLLSAGDLAKGSKTVKIQGEPTALENASEVSTSSGDEAGTQGGGVVTHKTKGKGSFTLWSFTVKVEGKGVGRHGDPMNQNTGSALPNCVDATAMTDFKALLGTDAGRPCTMDWDEAEHYSEPNTKQDEACLGGPCWECAKSAESGHADPSVWDTAFKIAGGERVLAGGRAVMVKHKKGRRHRSSTEEKEGFTPDHQPPQRLAWEMGGCHMQPSPKAFKDFMQDKKNVKPHCKKHSSQQGGNMRSWMESSFDAWRKGGMKV